MDEISAMASRSAASDHCLVDRISLTPEEAAALLNAPESAVTPLAKRISDLLLARELLVVDLASLRWSVPQTRQLAHRLAFAMASAMRDAQLPPGLRVEIDVPQETFVPIGFETRTLIPHHDGGHISYLSPSILDDPSWNPADRNFAPHGHCEYSTPTQKLYQGLFIAEQGAAASSLGFFSLGRILVDVFKRRVGREPTVKELILWYGANLRNSLQSRGRHGGNYPSLAGFAGSDRDEYLGYGPHCAESTIDAHYVERLPGLKELGSRCACGTCPGPAGRVFCNMLQDVYGRSWPEFRRHYQSHLLATQQSDLVFWNNLTYLHAGFDGSRTRLLEPIGFVVDHPVGSQYEEWLRAIWRTAVDGKATSSTIAVGRDRDATDTVGNSPPASLHHIGAALARAGRS